MIGKGACFHLYGLLYYRQLSLIILISLNKYGFVGFDLFKDCIHFV